MYFGIIFGLLIFTPIYALEDNFRIYQHPDIQVLRDASCPIYVANQSPNGLNGVSYSLIQGFAPAPPRPSLRDDILQYISLPVNTEFTFYNTKVQIQIFKDASYWVQYISGPSIQITPEEVVEMFVNQRKPRQPRFLSNNTTTYSTDTLYPEILVVVHYELFELLGKDIPKTVNYVTEFWAKADLRFRVMENPKIRINIAGIVIASNYASTPYSYQAPRNLEEWNAALIGAGKYFHRQREISDSFDVVMIMHKFLLRDVPEGSGYFDGMAQPRSACRREINEDGNIFNAVGMLGDDAHFYGVHVGAHELAHILGAVHDHNEYSPSLNEWCPRYPNIALVMTYRAPNDYIYDEFSACSVSSMKAYLQSSRAECLRNRPVIRNSIARTLKVYTLLEQCQLKYGRDWNVQSSSQNPCQTAMCYGSSLMQNQRTGRQYVGSRTQVLHPVDGTICGDGKICLKNTCVPVEEGVYVIRE